jgi:hypothetical protein
MAQLKISDEQAPPVVSKKNSKFRYKKKKNQYERQVLGRRENSPRPYNFQFRAPAVRGNQQAGTGNQPVGNQPAGMSNQQRPAQLPVNHSGMSNQQRPAQLPVNHSGMSNQQRPAQLPVNHSGMSNQQRPAQFPVNHSGMNQSLPNLPKNPAHQNISDSPRYYSRRVKIFFLG